MDVRGILFADYFRQALLPKERLFQRVLGCIAEHLLFPGNRDLVQVIFPSKWKGLFIWEKQWLTGKLTETLLSASYGKMYTFMKCLCVHAQLLSPVWLFVTPWTVAHQAPQSMGFPMQKYCSGFPFPSSVKWLYVLFISCFIFVFFLVYLCPKYQEL